MKALVIGATGQLGANLVRALLNTGDEVRAMIRSSSRTMVLEGLEVERVTGDLNDLDSLIQACEGVNTVYHAAGYYPTATIPVERATARALVETRNVLDAVRTAAVDRLVFTSTLTTIGLSPPGVLATEAYPFSTTFRTNPYLMAKAAMEDEVLAAARRDVPAVVVVPTAFFGPYDSKPTSGTQILLIAKRRMPGYVQGRVNVIDVRDVAVAMIRAAERGRVGERYIVGHWNTTQKDLNALIAEVVGVPPPFVPVPFALARFGARLGEWVCRTILRTPPPVPAFFVEVLQHMQHYDCSKAIQELDYPRSPVERAIRDAVEWFREHRYL